MFVLQDKINKTEYSVLDTDDNVVDVCTYDKILYCVLNLGISIQGVSVKGNEVYFDKFNIKYKKKIIGNKFRIYPTNEQKIMFSKMFGCCRFIWNKMLSDRIEYYNLYGESLNNHYNDYYVGNDFLLEVPARILQMTERNLNRAYKNFFRRVSNGDKNSGFPNFKKKYDRHQSFQIYNDGNCIKLGKKDIFRHENDKTLYKKSQTDTIKLPKIDKPIKIKLHKPIRGRITTVTISKNACDEYYCSMNTEEWVEVNTTKTDKVVGIDLGIKDLAILSDGSKLGNDKILDSYLSQLRYYQQCFSRTQSGSNRRNKLRKKISRLHRKIANKRLDRIHKFTSDMVNKNQVIITEDLNIKGLLSNKTHTRKKRVRSRHISDASWYEFIRQFSYKCDWYEKTYQKVGKNYPSTQLCHVCGYKNKELRNNIRIREWLCPICNTYHDRDINAAINIEKEGRRILGIA